MNLRLDLSELGARWQFDETSKTASSGARLDRAANTTPALRADHHRGGSFPDEVLDVRNYLCGHPRFAPNSPLAWLMSMGTKVSMSGN